MDTHVDAANVLSVYKSRLSEEIESHIMTKTAWMECQQRLTEVVAIMQHLYASGEPVDLNDPSLAHLRMLIGVEDGAPRMIQAVPNADEG